MARLATADVTGRPHLVPFVYALVTGALYSVVDGKPKTDPTPGARMRRLDNIRANPSVSVLVDHYADDWSQLWWARADGIARVIDLTDPEAGEPLAALIERYPPYAIAPPPGPMIGIVVQRWSGWSANGRV